MRETIETLDLDTGQVQMFMVNHRAVSGDYPLRSGDRVAVFPDDYVVFADWAGYRSKPTA